MILVWLLLTSQFFTSPKNSKERNGRSCENWDDRVFAYVTSLQMGEEERKDFLSFSCLTLALKRQDKGRRDLGT